MYQPQDHQERRLWSKKWKNNWSMSNILYTTNAMQWYKFYRRKYMLTKKKLQYDHLEPSKSKCFVWSLYSIIFNFITCLDIVTMGHSCFYLFFLIRFQWDRKGPEFRTWSGSGPKCQKWSGKGPELATRSWMFLDAPDMTEYTNVYICIICIQSYQGISKNSRP